MLQHRTKRRVFATIVALIACALLATFAGLALFFLVRQAPPLWSWPAGEILFGIVMYFLFGLTVGLPTIGIIVVAAVILRLDDAPVKISLITLIGGASGFLVMFGLLFSSWNRLDGMAIGLLWLTVESVFAGGIPGLAAGYAYSWVSQRSIDNECS